ncbi:dockerin type I domain-containing protein [Lachnoclostridium sp. MSJ-17]|uniref:dockerin type I domain-containing protein n=1 Tax=Lachnoclostridium sp. MSJ-17 TaxID=2841516 RepID=UPI001C0F9412|nr:dockerin type I domain-containing protein [Lachnoclostridium sp. MSJ-17]MBU5461676.1 CHAP domain-containing protein [Lachnoclostridium sp. MSJ-17]
MKIKRILCVITAAALLASSLFSLTAYADDSLVYSEEYKSSPYYERLTAALSDSEGKSTMEKTLAAALSQEGYLNYATQGVDIEQAKADGLIWTGKELRMNAGKTGNTEYTRWAQAWIMGENENAQYLDCDWCAIFVSWCLYQGGYYTRDELKKYYYAYCAEPRIEFAADSWILAYDLDQKNVWYAPKAHHKLDSYNWNTYYNIDVDPYDMPYKPGGLVFVSWDGSGDYFDHVAIVTDYDAEEHVLTFINGNLSGKVATAQLDLDEGDVKNSDKIMAYADYDEIKQLEPRKLYSQYTDIMWDKSASSGFSFQTDSDSKVFSVYVDGEYMGSNIESNMILREGMVIIGKSELVNLEAGKHDMIFTFDDGELPITLTVTDENSLENKLYGDLDLDGKITVDDATLLQRAAVDYVRMTDTQTALADTNGDGRVSVLDVTCVQKYIAGFTSGMGKTGEIY